MVGSLVIYICICLGIPVGTVQKDKNYCNPCIFRALRRLRVTLNRLLVLLLVKQRFPVQKGMPTALRPQFPHLEYETRATFVVEFVYICSGEEVEVQPGLFGISLIKVT